MTFSSSEDMQDALKDLLGGTIKEMVEAEMEEHLGYGKSECFDHKDYRNRHKRKRVNSRYGSMEIEVTQKRKTTVKPQVVKRRWCSNTFIFTEIVLPIYATACYDKRKRW